MENNENNPLLEGLNLKNLRIAVDGIKKLDIDDRNFDISFFGGLIKANPTEAKKLIHQCDTIACFLGWFPFVKELKPAPNDYRRDLSLFDYRAYCIRILSISEDSNTAIWAFLFSGNWSNWDPTLYGALARSEYVLNGKYTDDWDYIDFSEGWNL